MTCTQYDMTILANLFIAFFSVHTLHPGDINVIGAMGDFISVSITFYKQTRHVFLNLGRPI